MITETARKVAEIEFEQQLDHNADAPEHGRTHTLMDAPLMAQPRRIRLDNDGCHSHWISPGAVWTLEHDGTGWRATTDAPGWEGSREHVMRLADVNGPHGSYVNTLPLADGGRTMLLRGTTYQLRLGADRSLTRTVLILSIVE